MGSQGELVGRGHVGTGWCFEISCCSPLLTREVELDLLSLLSRLLLCAEECYSAPSPC